jgi:transcription elongation factor GreA
MPTKKSNTEKKVSEKKTTSKTKVKKVSSKEISKKPKKTTSKKELNENLNNDNALLLTQDGLNKLKSKLKELETVKRKEVAERLKEAISYGDLSENSEYQEAKEEQAFVESQIIEIQKKLKNAKVVSSKQKGIIGLGSKVSLENLTRGEKEDFFLVGSVEVDPFKGKISNQSPLGKSILGKKKGDEVLIKAPAGEFLYKILKVE